MHVLLVITAVLTAFAAGSLWTAQVCARRSDERARRVYGKGYEAGRRNTPAGWHNVAAAQAESEPPRFL